ncbi:MAG TPA: hypothetical protein DD621_04540 [Clostridiales bacterium]|nr:hypothetical protein [Clostridiales bacterium]
MKKSIAVIGLGRFGMSILKTLAESKCDVIGIDNNKDCVAEAGKYVQHVVICDSTKKEHLEELGVQNVNHAVVCIGKNSQASILTVINLKELGVEKISVRVDDEEYIKVMQKLGATEIMFPERDFGIDIAKRISLKDSTIEEYYELEDGFVHVKFKVNENFTPIKIKEVKSIVKFEVLVALIIRGDIAILPDGEAEIQPNDTLYVIGKHAKVVKFESYVNG